MKNFTILFFLVMAFCYQSAAQNPVPQFPEYHFYNVPSDTSLYECDLDTYLSAYPADVVTATDGCGDAIVLTETVTLNYTITAFTDVKSLISRVWYTEESLAQGITIQQDIELWLDRPIGLEREAYYCAPPLPDPADMENEFYQSQCGDFFFFHQYEVYPEYVLVTWIKEYSTNGLDSPVYWTQTFHYYDNEPPTILINGIDSEIWHDGENWQCWCSGWDIFGSLPNITAVDNCDASPTLYTDLQVYWDENFENPVYAYYYLEAVDDQGNWNSYYIQEYVGFSITITTSGAPSYYNGPFSCEEWQSIVVPNSTTINCWGQSTGGDTPEMIWAVYEESTCVVHYLYEWDNPGTPCLGANGYQASYAWYSVYDDSPPVIELANAEVELSTEDQIPLTIPATDMCDTLVCITFDDTNPGSGPYEWLVERTWTATDNCGNQSQAVQTFHGPLDTGEPCLGDLNADDSINVTDLLLFTGEYGCNAGCGLADLNGDGSVNVSDLLIFTGAFGTSC